MMHFCPDGHQLSLLEPSVSELDLSNCFHLGVLQPCIFAICLIALVNRARFLSHHRHDLPRDMLVMGRLLFLSKVCLTILNWTIAAVKLALVIALPSPSPPALAPLLGQFSVLLGTSVAIRVHFLEHARSRRAATSLCTYYSLLMLSTGVHMRSILIRKAADDPSSYLAVMAPTCIQLGLALVLLLLENCSTKPIDTRSIPPSTWPLLQPESPEARTSFIGKLFFTWVWELLRLGSTRGVVLTLRDLWRLPSNLGSKLNCARLAVEWEHERLVNPSNPSLLWPIFRAFGTRYALIALLAFGQAGLNFLTPLFVEYYVHYLTVRGTTEARSQREGTVMAVVFLALNLLETVMYGQGYHNIFLEQIRIKAALQDLIYRKGLRLPSSTLGCGDNGSEKASQPNHAAGTIESKGEILNLATVDTQSICNGLWSVAEILTAPIAVLVAMYLLYRQVGWAMIVALVILLSLIPFMSLFAHRMHHHRSLMLAQTDARIKVTTETVTSIKTLKLYGWTRIVRDRILGFRNQELVHMKSLQWIMACQVVMSFVMPSIATAGTIAIASLTSERNAMTSSKMFAVLSVMRMLNQLLETVVWGWNPVVEAHVSQERIRKFLLAQELQVYVECVGDCCGNGQDVLEKDVECSTPAIHISNAKFAFAGTKEVLHVPDLKIKRGCLTAIVGSVGSGKTALVHAMLGEMVKLNPEGRVKVFGCKGIAYVPQQPWVLNASVKSNILFGSPLDETMYRSVVSACALDVDFQLLDKGDETLIGERGIALSGGQRARISIARAAYAAQLDQQDVIVMDDPLSAVDAHVDRRIFDSLLHPTTGLLRSKTIVLVTHAVHHLKDTGHIILVDNGRIVEQGVFSELVSIPSGRVAKLMLDYESNSVLSEDTLVRSPTAEVVKLNSEAVVSPKPSIAAEIDASAPRRSAFPRDNSMATLLPDTSSDKSLSSSPPSPTDHHSSNRPASVLTPLSIDRIATVGQRSLAGMSHGHGHVESPIFPMGNSIDSQLDTHQTVGSVSWRVYWHYVKSCGIRNVGIVLASCILGVGLSVVVTYWLAAWGSASDRGEDNSVYYLSVYVALVVGNALLSGFNTAYSMTVSAVHGARATMQAVLDRVLRAPMSFHTTTPIGQVTARFGTDQAKVDSDIPDHWDYLMWTVIQTAFVVVTIMIAAPWFILLLVPLGFVFLGIQRMYLSVSREVQRITLLLAGPVYSHLSETVNGLACLRAFGHGDRFALEAEGKFDQVAGGSYNLASVQRWLLVNLQIIGNLVVAGVTLFAVLVPTVSSANMAVALNYSFEVTFLISLAVRLYGQLENAIISVERLKEYTELPTEAIDETPASVNVPPNWPAVGRIEFKDFSTRYRDGLPLALDAVSLVIPPGTKVGVCGRTGSGKTTLAMSMFRLIESVEGSIEVDGVDIGSIGLNDLRGKLTVLPQDPVIFDATIRDNLDPNHMHTDDTLWAALDNAHLSRFIRDQFPAGLEGRLAPDSLSAGQAQLFCLARALLRKSKVLVLDEISASIDLATDQLVQATIRREFAECTVLTIAHRIGTIIDSDVILVLESGKVAEFDPPSVLLADAGSVFYSLAVESKLVGQTGRGKAEMTSSSGSLSTLLDCGGDAESATRVASVAESKEELADHPAPVSPTSPTLDSH